MKKHKKEKSIQKNLTILFVLLLLSMMPVLIFSLASTTAWASITASETRSGSTGINLRSMNLGIKEKSGLVMEKIGLSDGQEIQFKHPLPLFTILLSEKFLSSTDIKPSVQEASVIFALNGPSAKTLNFHVNEKISGVITQAQSSYPGISLNLRFENQSSEKIKLENLVPLGEGPGRVYITAGLPNKWPHHLSRTLLYRPGKKPVGVLCPDNAWHLGFCDLAISPSIHLTALARRDRSEKAEVRRWVATLEPGGWIEYNLYFDLHLPQSSNYSGLAAEVLFAPEDWFGGVKMMFQERFLYDLEKFDNTLFERADLQWIRKAYLMLLQFAWDHTYYDYQSQEYTFYQNLSAWDKLVGGIDIYSLWPTWPRLGLDQRNQWDMYRDLPGGSPELKRQVEFVHQKAKKYFISYNPWDESTRHEEHLKAMEAMLREIQADGVILDTRGESSREFQEMADRVKPGIIMHSEGMAVPRDMPGIVAGRVHDALFLPPPLNLNKFIKPEFAIFRVIQLGEGRFRREASVAFFNGYGCEINTMRPGRPDSLEEDLRYLGRTTKILRENHSVFIRPDWIPLYPTLVDGLWANCWPGPEKIIFTIFSLKPEGYSGPLVPVKEKPGVHYVSLWRHEEIKPQKVNGPFYLPAEIEGFSQHHLDTRLEGNVECLAVFPEIIKTERIGDRLVIRLTRKPAGSKLIITPGNPSYEAEPRTLPASDTEFSLREKFGGKGEKIVIQLFSAAGEILDEKVSQLPPALPRLLRSAQLTSLAEKAPEGMVEIPAGEYVFTTTGNPDDPNPVIPYPEKAEGLKIKMRRFFIDKYPVTNAQFASFLKKSGYKPEDPTNFLKHWINAKPPRGQENHPVIWVSLEDAEAYARWAGKRLPTEIEWQCSAQGNDGRLFPWGNEFDASRCNNKLAQTTAVDSFPAGASPFGVLDLVGNVWQLTADVYDNGAYSYVIIKGGSYYSPEASIWYPRSGPLALNRQQILLLLAPGLDRCATVGFRCVKDAVQIDRQIDR